MVAFSLWTPTPVNAYQPINLVAHTYVRLFQSPFSEKCSIRRQQQQHYCQPEAHTDFLCIQATIAQQT